jgi:signal transduction histidine kinase
MPKKQPKSGKATFSSRVLLHFAKGRCWRTLRPVDGMRVQVPFFTLVVLCVLVLVEVAVLVPVIVTQRVKDEGLVGDQLQALTDDFAERVNMTIASFMYNVVRAAAAAPTSGFLSQQGMEDAILVDEDPINTPSTLYFWLPIVSAAERDNYQQFYGFNITDVKNGTHPTQVLPASNRLLYIPYTIFVPRLPATTNPIIYGLDLLPFNATTTSVLFKNASKFLSIPSALIASNRTNNNYGFVAVVQNKYGRGHMFGRIGSQELLEFSLTVPRSSVLLAAYVTSANASRQALFFEAIPDLANATTLAIFNALPSRRFYYIANFTSFGETILVAVRYSDTFGAQFVGNTWVILAAVLAPVCFLINVIWVILALLWERRKKLLELEKRKRQEAQVMISYVNHEIRNPLQTILGLADMHLEQAIEERDPLLASDLSTIVRSAEFIEHIARDILDLRRVEEGKLEIEVSDVDVKQFVNGLEKAVVSIQARKSGVDFKVNVDREIHTIRSDRYRLEQIMLNFLTNAFKHTEEGVVSLSVALASPAVIRFAVWDTGKGIAAEKKEKLFKQFSQVSSEDATDFGGFGLGLYLTKMLATLLGGNVGFESTLGLGSVFWVDLPAGVSNAGLMFQFEESKIPLKM